MKWTEEQLDRRRRPCTKHRCDDDGLEFKNDSIHGEGPAARFALVDMLKRLPRMQRPLARVPAACSGNHKNAWSRTSVKLAWRRL